jgi:hypothetical protein
MTCIVCGEYAASGLTCGDCNAADCVPRRCAVCGDPDPVGTFCAPCKAEIDAGS